MDASRGRLIFVEDRLVAVLVHLDKEEHAEPELTGKWFLEAEQATLVFGSLEEAQRWVNERIASAGRRR
jgi:hypothetical protein